MASARLAALALAALASAAPWTARAQDCGGSYTIRQGDTLDGIAARCGTTVAALVEANPRIADPARITVGWELTVPGGTGANAIAEEWERRRDAAAAPVLEAGRYTVEPGDSMASIATKLGLPLDALLAANEGVDPFVIRPGQELMLPGDPAAEPDTAGGEADSAGDEAGAADDGAGAVVEQADTADEDEAAATYTVEPGDSMAGIAAKLGVSLDTLIAANAGTDPTLIRPGQELALPEGAAGEDPAAAPEGEEPDEAPGAGEGPGPDASGEAAGSAPEEAAMAEPPKPEPLTLEGRIRKGVECPVLTTPEGRTYSLVSQTYGFTPGDYVSIVAEPVEMSLCMQGQTVRVTSMTPKPAPQGG